jgi:dTDP-4-amino-4,6-dideoxygalactose transaminase
LRRAETAVLSQERLPLRRVRLPAASKVLPYLREVDRANWYTNFGSQSRTLERRLAEKYGVAPATVLAAANGTVALTAALLAMELPRDSYCIVPSFTFTGTVSAVLMAGLKPWFVDVDRDSWALDPNALRALLARAPGPVSAAMPVAPFGAPLAHAPWREFEARTGIRVLIDAAWCFDSLGPITVSAMVSLHATKAFGVGEGAFIVDPSQDYITRARAICNYGIEGDQGSVRIGGNFKMSEYAAAVGQAALDGWPQRRRQALRVKRWYLEDLGRLKGTKMMPGYANDWAPATFALLFDEPMAWSVLHRLHALNIESRMWWGNPCHRMRAYREYPRTDMASTEWLCERVLCLPFFESMQRSDVRRVALAVREALATP